MSYFVAEYLVGGFGSLSRVVADSGYANNHEEFLSKFWSRYEGMVDCAKPIIIHFYLSEKGKLTEIELEWAQKTGKN